MSINRFVVRDHGNWYVVDNITEVRVLCNSLEQAINIAYTYI